MFPASWADFRGWLRVDGGSRVLKCFWPGREVEMQVQSPLALDRGSVSHGSYQCPEQGTSIKILLFPDRNTGFDTQFNGFRGLAVGGAGGTVSVCCHWMKAREGGGLEIRECGAGRLFLSLVSCRSIPRSMCYLVTIIGELLLLKREKFAHARN